MKIGLDPASAAPSAPYARRLAELLAKYAPQHRCVTDARRCADADLYHGQSLIHISEPTRLRRISDGVVGV